MALESGDELVRLFGALSNPHRLRILGELGHGREYVSRLARRMDMSRPLLNQHLKRLEAAGLVTSSYEVSEDGKAMKYYEAVPLDLHLTPAVLARAAATLTLDTTQDSPEGTH